MIRKYGVFMSCFPEKLLCVYHIGVWVICRAVICFDIKAIFGLVLIFYIFDYALDRINVGFYVCLVGICDIVKT